MSKQPNSTVQMQKQLYGIGIFEAEIVLSDFTNGSERRFVVTPDQLMGFIHSDITLQSFPGLIWMKAGAGSEKYLLTLPAGQRTILYRRKKNVITKRLQLPAIAIEAGIEPVEKQVRTIRMWGFAGRQLKPDSILYELPLPNLGGSHLCLGSTERAVDRDILGAVERTIFDTPFNHHNHLVGREKLPFHDYVKKYAGRCPFHTLTKIGHGRDILGGHLR